MTSPAVHEQQFMAGDLRYMCGWYSITAPLVGLPVPLDLWALGRRADARIGKEQDCL